MPILILPLSLFNLNLKILIFQNAQTAPVRFFSRISNFFNFKFFRISKFFNFKFFRISKFSNFKFFRISNFSNFKFFWKIKFFEFQIFFKNQIFFEFQIFSWQPPARTPQKNLIFKFSKLD